MKTAYIQSIYYALKNVNGKWKKKKTIESD